MNVKILYDNQAKEGFTCGWGFSSLINDTTLFDTGENAESLLANIKAFGIDLGKIQRLILSHEDWDHIGGIEVIKKCGKLDIYLPVAFSAETKEKIHELNPQATVIEINDTRNLGNSMYVTAQLGFLKKEISLAVQSDKGVVLVVGCSHPGLLKIMKKASELGKIFGVIGGFHGFRKLSGLADVPYIVPTHCTQKKEAIRERYPDQTHFVKAGSSINI